jgi:hypothetical protein
LVSDRRRYVIFIEFPAGILLQLKAGLGENLEITPKPIFRRKTGLEEDLKIKEAFLYWNKCPDDYAYDFARGHPNAPYSTQRHPT